MICLHTSARECLHSKVIPTSKQLRSDRLQRVAGNSGLNSLPRWTILLLLPECPLFYRGRRHSRVKAMSQNEIPEELKAVREQIDAIDERLLQLLGQRFELTHQVGVLKADRQLSSLDASRESEKLARLRELCTAHGLNPDLVEELFSRIMREVVQNHDKLRQDQES